MRHFGIYSDSSELEQAYQNGDIINPYVALVSGSLDYNGIQPEPCYLGEWSDDGEGTYTFQITDTWKNPLQIGVFRNVLFNGSGTRENVPVYLNYDPENYLWYLTIGDPEDNPVQVELASRQDDYIYEVALEITSEVEVYLYYNWGGDIVEGGDGSLALYSVEPEYPLSMTTINPLCSDGEPVTCQDSCGGDPECECLCQGEDYYWDSETETCMQYSEPAEELYE